MKEREQRLSLDLDLNLDQAGAGHSRWFMKIRAGVFSKSSVTGIQMQYKLLGKTSDTLNC